MAQSNPATIARPYSKAAFEAAVEGKALESWSRALALLASLVKQPRVVEVIEDPRLNAERQAEIIIQLCSDELEPKVKNFVVLLAEHKRLPVLDEIHAQFEVARDEYERRVEVNIISAYALNEEQQNKLAQALKKRLDRDISITTSVDDSLIGGVIIQAGDTVIDGSVRGRLAELKDGLKV